MEFITVYINRPGNYKRVGNKISTTKYNIFTFIPRFLFEQFRKYANIYFLCIALLQQIPDVSPTGRYTTLFPLCVIISISALREILEDFKRKRSDDETNNKKVPVLSKGEWKELKWADLKVGDIVQVKNEEHFPADLVLLNSSEQQGTGYIETSNLDGETNLKVKTAIQATTFLDNDEEVANFNALLELQQPNKLLQEFAGNIQVNDDKKRPLGLDQLLLRGARLKNTAWIYGVIAYAGYETKLMLNANKIPLKRSSVDRVVNKQVLMMFCVLLLLSWASALGAYFYTKILEDQHWYLGFSREDYAGNLLFALLTFIILYNNLIPISLQVTLEMVKFIQAIFIGMDYEMFHAETKTAAAARTSNLNEELGQVKYIFSDKTGTLTSNVMTLRLIYAGGITYWKDFEDKEDDVLSSRSDIEKEEFKASIKAKRKMMKKAIDTLSDDLIIDRKKAAKDVLPFLIMCAVCHTVVPEADKKGEINYQAASPDERALVIGAKKVGVEFIRRTTDTITFSVDGDETTYRLLNVFEFTSSRKRMTVIIKDTKSNIEVMVKGADTIITDLIGGTWSNEVKSEVNRHLEAYSVMGLRTLCFAKKTVSQAEYDEWKERYYKASIATSDRTQRIEDAIYLIEKNVKFVGISGIEDKLQDGVPDAINSLLIAGIRIWVLTGDKQETAINIGMSSKLIEPNMEIIRLNHTDAKKTKASIDMLLLRTPWKDRGKEKETALVVDGTTLKYALSKEMGDSFLKVAVTAKVVICCRVSPSQKTEIVYLVKNGCNAVTLAIGDGANDVGMIQEAHVGVGISGQEGLQAVCASDYSIAQFRYLKKLLLVHGHWNYCRVIKLILFSFYKNICFYFIEFWYAFLNAFSGQIIFERWTIGLYNVLFTALPPLAIGVFDQAAPESLLLANPQFYQMPQSKDMFNVKVFWMWCLNAIYVSLVVFWLPCGAMYHDNVFADGKVASMFFVGCVIYTVVIVTVCIKALIEMNYWNKMVFTLVLGSIALWIVFLPIYCSLWPSIEFAEHMVGMDSYLFSSPVVYLQVLIVPMVALLRDLSCKILYRNHLLINANPQNLGYYYQDQEIEVH